ncbi:hypothetical protein QYE76_012233 [Lolium multiflorum]|uniref:CCHC-type domain-containing protein n=1 Tax=Lolium multiflorum TaxID=4521 RepID=A0AAD8X3R7_LOLMU|nr:hypothetical protein QYE76_012233 [Lolium multiflorum]
MPPAQTYRPNHRNNNGGPPKPGGNNNHNSHNNNGNNTNTGPRTGSNAIPVTPKDKSTVNCYECGVVGHYSKECPKKLAKIAANTATPAQQQRRFASRKNQNNNNGRLYHMTATEAQKHPRPRQHNLAQKHLLITTTLPVPSWSSPTHGIGQASRAQTRQKRARHAVSAPRRRPGRASARPRLDSLDLLSLSPFARMLTTPTSTR